jgi:hypothetical protein
MRVAVLCSPWAQLGWRKARGGLSACGSELRQIFHGKKFAKRGAPVDKPFVLKQTLGNKIHEFVVGALTISPLPRWRL